ncbi:ESF1 homolog [Physella acuta]|uniref:ESF1 homolog n=1 Tax=Physella acuta TaxID=109671 RepID=UPI0027DB4E57|nr:ESF1 homolog [Physella acuta]
MADIKDDPRFSHISSDPRFRPMPKSKRKVKLDSRFKTLFTSTHFSHRTDIDKRGRPVLDFSKRNKHVMERFYDLSDSDEIENNSVAESDSEDDEKTIDQKKGKRERKIVKKTAQLESDDLKGKSKEPKSRKRKAADSLSPSNAKQKKPEKILKSKSKLKKKKNEEVSSEEDTGNEDIDKEDESDSVDDDDDESDEDESDIPEFTPAHAIEETEVDHRWNELHTDALVVSESTRRIAVCNMDWDYVKAQDLFILFKSFVPEGGQIKSVTIYPSEFGKERMVEEAMLGPKEIREGLKVDEVEDKKNKKKTKDQQKAKQTEKEKEAAQTEKLREYQLNRLRYYYAVVDCDSVQTADAIYNECDGREYQLSCVRLDLRYIPDDMTFDDTPKDRFSEEQSTVGYQPSKFNSTALSQAKVEVTWDETEFDRLSRQISSLQQKDLESIVEENKYADIIAPPESDSEDEEDGRPSWLRSVLDDEEGDKVYTEEEKIQLYRKVLMDKLEEEEQEKKEEEGDMDKEVEFTPGLKSSVEKKLKKKEKQKDSSIVNEFLEKKKEKKRKKKEERMKKKKIAGDDENEKAFSDDDLPDDVDMETLKELMDVDAGTSKTSQKKDKKRKKKKKYLDEKEGMDEKERAELELILMDGDNDHKSLQKPEPVKQVSKKKQKKLAKKKKDKVDKEDFKLDVDDPRFSALYSSHLFHIDPTAPQFKKTKNMEKLVNEQIKRKGKLSGAKSSTNSVQNDSQPQTVDSKALSKSLLESLKRKMKK